VETLECRGGGGFGGGISSSIPRAIHLCEKLSNCSTSAPSGGKERVKRESEEEEERERERERKRVDREGELSKAAK